jgi:acyl-CoA dehydrogenase
MSARVVPGDDDEILDAIDRFVATVVVPLEEQNAAVLTEPRARFAPSGSYSPQVLALKQQVRMASAHAGFYTMFAPTDIGGGGKGPILHYRVWEQLYHRCGPDRLLPLDTIAHLAGGPSVALSGVSAEQRRDVLPGLMSGELVLCWAFSEADANRPLSTIARFDSGHWYISGTKHWVSRSPYADVVMVFARTGDDPDDRQMTAFLLPTGQPGMRVDPPTRLFGRAGGEEATLSLDRAPADASQIVGRVDEGIDVASSVNNLATMFTAGRFIGLARWVLDQTARHQQGSDPSAAHLALADSVIELRGAHLMAVDCGRRIEEDRATPEDMAMVRAFATEACCRAYDRCMLAFGAASLTSASRIFDGWHQSRIVLLADSGVQSAKTSIARRLLAADTPF